MKRPSPTKGVQVRTLATRYELGAEIGGGGTATVHRGLDLRLDRPVAIKLFRVEVDKELKRVESELKILASLHHPSLVMLYDAGEDPEAFLVMELVEGPTLSQGIRERVLPWTEIAKIGESLAAGLEHAHKAGVVHRDVKPANILLGENGAKLTDFGIAQLENGSALTQTGLTVGTAHYLSPEQVKGSRGTHASDIYSLGLSLIEALTGKRCYEGVGAEVAFLRLEKSPEVPIVGPVKFQVLLESMTQTDPAQRPTAKRVQERFQEILLEANASSEVTKMVPRPQRVILEEVLPSLNVLEEPEVELVEISGRKEARTNIILASLLAVLMLAILGFTFYVFNQRKAEPVVNQNKPAVPQEYEGPLSQLEDLTS